MLRAVLSGYNCLVRITMARKYGQVPTSSLGVLLPIWDLDAPKNTGAVFTLHCTKKVAPKAACIALKHLADGAPQCSTVPPQLDPSGMQL